MSFIAGTVLLFFDFFLSIQHTCATDCCYGFWSFMPQKSAFPFFKEIKLGFFYCLIFRCNAYTLIKRKLRESSIIYDWTWKGSGENSYVMRKGFLMYEKNAKMYSNVWGLGEVVPHTHRIWLWTRSVPNFPFLYYHSPFLFYLLFGFNKDGLAC